MKEMMDVLIRDFSKQLRTAISIGEKAVINPAKKEIRNILITGLGGSGIGGNLCNQFCEGELNVPIQVNKDYFIPNFVGEHTLVIISSYSGNTEETLQAFKEAEKKGAHIVCISSGGRVIEIAKEKNYDHVIIPGGDPPRTCVGYSLTQQLYILNKLGLISNEPVNQLKEIPDFLDKHENNIQSLARDIAEDLYDKLPVIYISAGMETIAVRFRQQLNENSKILCWHHVIPEMNHNELVGWRNKDQKLAVVIFRNENDYDKIQKRIEINKTIIEEYTSNIFELYSIGENNIERSMYFIHLGDWISFFIAEHREMDAVEVNVIDFLKSELKKKS
jgi:glucose/mannose-6-phosphate isomerase